jgi:hypothetical protein
MNVIQWKVGYRAKCSAEDAYKILEGIRKRDGNITPQAVLEEAKPESSPIHKAIYDKGQKAAATAYFEENARKMTRSIDVIYVKKGAPKTGTAAFVSVKMPTEGSKEPVKNAYQSTEEVMKDPVQRDEVLGRAIREAISYRRKYAALQELSQVFKVIDLFVEEFKLG